MSYVGKVSAGGETSLIGSTLFATCSTAATQAAKVAVIEDAGGIGHVFKGLTVHVLFTNSNQAVSPTFDIQGSDIGAKPLVRHRNEPPGTTEETSWLSESVLALTYDGARWQITGWLNTDTNTTYDDATESVHGLMSTEDKAKLNKMDTVTYTGVTVAEDDWDTDSPQTYSGYSFKAVLSLPLATVNHVPTVIFDPDQIESYGPAPVAVSGNQTVTVYVESKPTVDIEIPTVQLVKGNTIPLNGGAGT